MQSQSQSGAAPAPATDAAPSSTQLLDDVIVQTPPRPARADGIAVGTLDGFDDQGGALVSIPAFGLSRVSARVLGPLEASQVGQGVALGFEGGDPLRPIVLGMLLAAAAPMAPAPPAEPEAQTDVFVDGERVVLTAEHEIELRCGEAALILSADGRIQMRGTYITSHASATQRILGGSVNIN